MVLRTLSLGWIFSPIKYPSNKLPSLHRFWFPLPSEYFCYAELDGTTTQNHLYLPFDDLFRGGTLRSWTCLLVLTLSALFTKYFAGGHCKPERITKSLNSGFLHTRLGFKGFGHLFLTHSAMVLATLLHATLLLTKHLHVHTCLVVLCHCHSFTLDCISYIWSFAPVPNKCVFRINFAWKFLRVFSSNLQGTLRFSCLYQDISVI